MNIKKEFVFPKNIIQFIKFGIVGLSNTGIALAVYYGLLFMQVHYLIANVASWIVSVFNAFYWNNKYVFKNESTWLKALIRTYVSYGFSFLISTALLYIFVEWCRISTIVAPLLTLIVTIPINFLMNKLWTFR